MPSSSAPSARWVGSLLFYGVTLSTFYYGCIRPAMLPHNLLEEAQRFEQLDSRLAERLLSAVELSAPSGVSDSAAFRQQVQREVAQVIGTSDVRQLLPWQRIRRSLMTGSVAAGSLLLLCWIPGLHLPQRIARTLLPAADFGRMSRVAIIIEQPLPNSKVVPLGDLLAIVARVEGQPPELVSLETRSPNAAASQPMLAQQVATGDLPGAVPSRPVPSARPACAQ